MKLSRTNKLSPVLLLFLLCLTMAAADGNIIDDLNQIAWNWSKPQAYPQPLPGDLDIDTLSNLLNSGSLQWYMPRPEENRWDSIVAMKIHAPREVLWKMLTDYEHLPDLSKTIAKSVILERTEKGAKVESHEQTSVVNFTFNYTDIDQFTEEPPGHIHYDIVDGDLKGGQTDFYLIPVDDGKQTIAILRFYPNIRELSVFLGLVFDQLPIEWSVSVAGANSFLRDVRNAAEDKVGYDRPDQPGTIDYGKLDTATMLHLEKYAGGLIRETKDGKTLNGCTFVSVDATPKLVWEVLNDFDHYNDFLDGEYKIKERDQDHVVIDFTSPSISALIFSFGGWQMENKYTIQAPDYMCYRTISGVYEGSYGDFKIVPIDDGKRSLLFHSVSLDLDQDESLTTRMVKSGDFPFDTVMCISVAVSDAHSYKQECEARAKQAQ